MVSLIRGTYWFSFQGDEDDSLRRESSGVKGFGVKADGITSNIQIKSDHADAKDISVLAVTRTLIYLGS
jgi:hypothetical protein